MNDDAARKGETLDLVLMAGGAPVSIGAFLLSLFAMVVESAGGHVPDSVQDPLLAILFAGLIAFYAGFIRLALREARKTQSSARS